MKLSQAIAHAITRLYDSSDPEETEAARELDKHDPLALARALAARDSDKECRFCGKQSWGEELHDEGCPFRMAYQMIAEEDAHG